MKKIRNAKITTITLRKKQGPYPKPYPFLTGSSDVLYPEPMIYGDKIIEVNVDVIE